MSTRLSSRVYNPMALEVWFENVALDWEQHFSPEALREGREIYRRGQISGVELADEHATVHCTFKRKDTCYAVIEWAKEGPSVRFSAEDTAMRDAVAVAGLYEIEELIADEIEPLAYEAQSKSDRSEASELEETISMDTRDPRPLTPFLAGSPSGLRLTAYWKNSDGSKEFVFQGEGEALVTEEREALVRLTGKAKEAGFVFRRETKDFLMVDPDRIAPFFSHTSKRWEEIFGYLDLDFEAHQMAEGVRRVSVVGRVETVDASTMRVDWRMRLGRRWLDVEDAERLARIGKGIHIIPGFGLVEIDAEQSRALAEWRVAAAADSWVAQTWPYYMVFSLFGARGAELDLEDAVEAWRDSLLGDQNKEHTKTGKSVKLPEFLRGYQVHGVRWMAHLRQQSCHGLLADEMGLGKTLQILTLLNFYPFEDHDSLIVCPASVVPVWTSEAARWYPKLKTKVLKSGVRLARRAKGERVLWIASYTQLRRHKHLLGEVTFGYAVLDEAQQIKNPDAKVTQACCAIQANCRLALTGTPLENRMLDLWTVFRFLMPGLLGSRRRFEDAVGVSNADEQRKFKKLLQKQIAPFILRRTKDKVGGDLPPKVEVDLICPISPLQRQVYEDLLKKGSDVLGNDITAVMQTQAMNFFSLLTRLRQACCDPGLIPEVEADIRQSGKVEMLLVRLSEALQGDGSRKVVIFSQFVQLLKRIKHLVGAEFPEVDLYELTGETKDRSKPVEAFQNTKRPAVIFVSLRAGGTGITLHAADYLFLLDPWWNPAVESQAVDRVHRIGQSRRVFVYRMITQGTIEERIQKLKTEKRTLFENILGDLGAASDLREHFSDLQELAKLLPAN